MFHTSEDFLHLIKWSLSPTVVAHWSPHNSHFKLDSTGKVVDNLRSLSIVRFCVFRRFLSPLWTNLLWFASPVIVLKSCLPQRSHWNIEHDNPKVINLIVLTIGFDEHPLVPDSTFLIATSELVNVARSPTDWSVRSWNNK